MSIKSKDFVPLTTNEGFFSSEYATLEQTLVRVNDWLAENKVRVLNVETVVFPKSVEDDPTNSSGTKMSSSGQISEWLQIVRVWYVNS